MTAINDWIADVRARHHHTAYGPDDPLADLSRALRIIEAADKVVEIVERTSGRSVIFDITNALAAYREAVK